MKRGACALRIEFFQPVGIMVSGAEEVSMTHEDPPAGTTPNTRPSPIKAEADIQEEKRIEKVKALASAHRTAGTVTAAADGAPPKSLSEKS